MREGGAGGDRRAGQTGPLLDGIERHEFHRRRRQRSLVLALLLAGFVVLVFFATLAKLRLLAP